ncbi:Dam family site-specific DNA-(adenine-N6)-methyltransferase [Xenorhabdus sp. SF857]|uniref:DNA adenine methylase n=1 Tax=Xenorhabdus bakwenae TaxID=3026967 RepID=UPI00255837D6|nr:Dam family site-specific DNA-(adenine-N6)-methyltransferase [Xenorhabdus sp. SF857]WFQ78850.1 Dam family site-specific DNA-(adenine-N6)-methyltransferase [Xenorhabdus sp. SF857]WFQ80027.1 Dam family site-specific DNA-(adenine-N6)-methyltransferase [Xenorhabdus sp. SF857]WFQ80905.1 Dam family site-specific DNA-(adenine-N6)-methyltransferase [Xenorhabdus sp. SF857]
MANKTILKWAGSKARIMDKLLPHLPAGKRLVEPFAGSCAVMMNTDYPEYLVADANADLINLYREVNAVPVDVFLCKAEDYFEDWFHCFNTEDDYYKNRDIFNERPFATSDADKACLFLYLNRHGYNGLCRYNTKGEFNVPYGKYKKVYFPEAEIIAFRRKSRERASFSCLEWQDTLTLVDYGDVVYCDPPYLTKGKAFTQYHEVNFTPAYHEALAVDLYTLNAHLGVPVTVSNSIAAKSLYADLGFTIHEIDAPRTIAANGNRQPAKEIIAVLEGAA